MKKKKYDIYISDPKLEEEKRNRLQNQMIRAVEEQLTNEKTAFVAEVYSALQRKGLLKKEAKTAISSVLLEEIYYTVNDSGYDEERYEKALWKMYRSIHPMTAIPAIVLDVEKEIAEELGEVADALTAENYEGAAEMFLAIWPEIKEYVVENMYCETRDGIGKADIMTVIDASDYCLEPLLMLMEVDTILNRAHKYQETLRICEEILDLFGWEELSPDTIKDQIGKTLAEMGEREKSEAWYREWLEEESDNIICICGYATVIFEKGEAEEALAMVERYLPKPEALEGRFMDLYQLAAEFCRELGLEEKRENYEELAEEAEEILDDEMAYFEDQLFHRPVTKEVKIYPNDPCPCGSGKKYKKCCGRN